MGRLSETRAAVRANLDGNQDRIRTAVCVALGIENLKFVVFLGGTLVG